MKFSKKLKEKLDRLRYVGFFTFAMAEEKCMRLVVGRREKLSLYWLVDESDGVIADAKFQAFGPPGLLAAAEIVSELALRKNFDQISRITADLLDQHLPQESHPFINQLLEALEHAVQQCVDIPINHSYETTPIQTDFEPLSDGVPDWEQLTEEKKRQIIETVIDKEIRPYIELDAGGVQLIAFNQEREVVIAYEGACTTCHSSTGSTLSAIQQILKTRIHPSLFVTPQLGNAIS